MDPQPLTQGGWSSLDRRPLFSSGVFLDGTRLPVGLVWGVSYPESALIVFSWR